MSTWHKGNEKTKLPFVHFLMKPRNTEKRGNYPQFEVFCKETKNSERQLAGQPSDIRWLMCPHTSFLIKLSGFRNLFRNFQQQMFLANNMIHLPFKARLKLALPCYIKYMRSPLFSHTNSSFRRFLSQCCIAVGFIS